MTLDESVHWLLEQGYFERNQLGLMNAIKPPKKKDLDQYVYAIKTLIAFAVTLNGKAKVSLSRGFGQYDLRFKIIEPSVEAVK